MLSKNVFKASFLIIACFVGCRQNGHKQKNLSGAPPVNKIQGKSVPQWQGMLTRYHGWLGADGIYAISMDGVETRERSDSAKSMFWFSDTIWGDIVDDSLKDWDMVHNSIAYMRGNIPDTAKMKFFVRHDPNGKPLSVFTPHTPRTEEGEYYWLGDGVLDQEMDSTIYIFAYKIKDVPGSPFPFKQTGVCLIALPKHSSFPFPDQRQMDTPLFFSDSNGHTSYGACVLPDTKGARAPHPDGYIYVYGVRNHGELVVARVEADTFEDFSKWRYWDGSKWDADKHKAVALTKDVSNEMSVSFMEDGRVIAVYEKNGDSPYVTIQVGDSPHGPFYPPKTIYKTPEIYEDIDFYTYNAKAYPHLSKPGSLLISYNVNAFDFINKFKKYPHLLRPRFITVRYE